MSRDPNKLRARELMSKDVVVVYPHDSLHEALQLIVENRVYALPVVDRRDRCIGVLSCSDLIELTREFDEELATAGNADFGAQRWLTERIGNGIGEDQVSAHMSDNVATIHAETELPEAARIMLRNHVHRLPVVDDDGKLLGILSTMDVLRAAFETSATV